MIWLRFGSLNDDSRLYMTPNEVFKRTEVKLSTQFDIVNRWRKRGFAIVRLKREGKKPIINQY